MNCFQIVSLTYWTQRSLWARPGGHCCELLSDCIFDLLNTTPLRLVSSPAALWIAFRLYLWLIEHNHIEGVVNPEHVVNCFQIVSLTYWTQLCSFAILITPSCELLSDCIFDLLNTTNLRDLSVERCCELLSDCIFDLLNTTQLRPGQVLLLLWIAFRLYLWLIEHNMSLRLTMYSSVVNCFQIVSLTYWTQPIICG